MSISIRFQKDTNKEKALVKIKWTWADSGKQACFYSLPRDERFGMDGAVKALIKRFNTLNYRLKVQDDRMFIYDNQKRGATHEVGLLAEIRGGVRV